MGLHDLISSAAEEFLLSKAPNVAIVESCSENRCKVLDLSMFAGTYE